MSTSLIFQYLSDYWNSNKNSKEFCVKPCKLSKWDSAFWKHTENSMALCKCRNVLLSLVLRLKAFSPGKEMFSISNKGRLIILVRSHLSVTSILQCSGNSKQRSAYWDTETLPNALWVDSMRKVTGIKSYRALKNYCLKETRNWSRITSCYNVCVLDSLYSVMLDGMWTAGQWVSS